MLRKTVLFGLFSMLLLLFSGQAAFSQPKGYMVLKGGYFSPTGDFGGDHLTGAPYGELAGGFNWWLFGAELGVGYLKADNSLVDVKTVPILLSGKMQIPILFMAPYVRGGVGAYYSELELKSGEGKGGKWSTGYHGGLGIDFRLGSVILGIEGTYLATKADFNVGEVTLDGVTVTGNVGFRF